MTLVYSVHRREYARRAVYSCERGKSGAESIEHHVYRVVRNECPTFDQLEMNPMST